MGRKLNVFFYSMDSVGHVNACLGLAQELAKRGHNITFFTTKAFEGHFKKWNFNEIPLIKETKKENNKKEEEDPAKAFGSALLESGMLSNKSTLEKNSIFNEMMVHMWDESLDEVYQFDIQIQKSIEELKPDVIILEHVLFAPSVVKSGIPWVMVESANPLSLYNSNDLSPYKSGW